MSNSIVENTIIENNVRDVYSTYVKCDCGTELLEFQARDHDVVYKNDGNATTFTCLEEPTFALRYYGLLSHRDVKYGYNYFYVDGVERIKSLVSLLRKITDEGTDEDIDSNFYDETLPYNIKKKYGRGGICVVHYKDEIFTYIRKYRNLEKKKNVSWEIVLRKDNLKAFTTNMEQIIRRVENNPFVNNAGWITVLPE